MKGLSLPVNMIVIVALAVVVLLATTAFFYGGFKTGTVTTQAAWDEACGKAKQRGCSQNDFQAGQLALNDINGDGTNDDILTVCEKQFAYGPDVDLQTTCWEQCCR